MNHVTFICTVFYYQIKYDTRITASVNGSIKLVRRDRTTILVKDSGVVSYIPRAAWDTEVGRVWDGMGTVLL